MDNTVEATLINRLKDRSARVVVDTRNALGQPGKDNPKVKRL